MTDVLRRPYPPIPKKPIIGRFFIMIAALTSPPALGEKWTAATAHEHLLADSRLNAITDAERQRVHARARASLPRENPFFGFQREQSFGSTTAQVAERTYSGGADSYIWLGQTLDFSFRRELLNEAGARRANAEGLIGEKRKIERLLTFDAVFFAVVADTHRLRAHDSWLARLDELAARTAARETKGDASHYDLLRIQRERRKAEQARMRIELAREGNLAELRVWLDDPAAEIADDVVLAPARLNPHKTTPRPLLAQVFDERKKALAIEEAAAGRWFLPPVTVTLGGKTAEGYLSGILPDTLEAGYYATLQVPLPVFERGDDEREAIASARRSAELSAALLTDDVARKAESARAVSVKALDAVEAHRSAAKEHGNALVRTARAAWAGGELPLLALLEAERSVLDDALIAIDLTSTARQAELLHRALYAQSSRRRQP